MNHFSLLNIFSPIRKKPLLVISTIGLCIGLQIIYTLQAPTEYEAQTRLIMEPEQKNASLNLFTQLIPLDSLEPNKTQQYFLGICQSKTIQNNIYSRLNKQTGISIHLLKKELNLKKSFFVNRDKDGIFTLKIKGKNPQIIKAALIIYLDEIPKLNSQFELTATKKLFTILDPPYITPQPNLTFTQNLFVAVITGTLIGYFIALIRL